MIFDYLYTKSVGQIGDGFVMNGVIHHFAKQCNTLFVPVKSDFYDIFYKLYEDYPNIFVLEHELDTIPREAIPINEPQFLFLERYDQRQEKTIKVAPLWDEQVYQFYNLPFSYRYDKFRLPIENEASKNLYEQYKGDPYVLIHRKMRNETLHIWYQVHTNYRIIELTEDVAKNPLDYVDLIRNAEEIHCTPSCIFCLVDSMQTKAKLYYHDLRFDTMMRVNNNYNRNKWNIIRYDKKL